VSLIPFLEQIAAIGIPDVRTAIKSYEGKHIPTEFALREAKAREEFNRQLAEEFARKPKRSGFAWVNGALGMKPQGGGMTFDGAHSVAEGLAEGKMLADQIRESGIKRYQDLEKEIRENGEKWLKEEAEMEKKMQQEQMKSMKSGALSFWAGGGSGEKK
jgi:import inner membrane translocase subunit TIM50